MWQEKDMGGGTKERDGGVVFPRPVIYRSDMYRRSSQALSELGLIK